MNALRTTWAACIAGFVLALLVGLAADRSVSLSNDSADYVSAAHHMAAGDGFLNDIKWHFCDSAPVRHSALGERQPAYSAALAIGLMAGREDLALEVVTRLLAALAVAAIVALVGGLFGAQAAWICVPIAAAAPILIDADTLVGPTALYIAWLALFVLAAVAAVKDLRWSLAVGLLWALMALTRGEGMYAGVAGLIWLAWNRSWKAAAVSVGVMLIALVPYFAANAHINGSPFVSASYYHVRVRTFSECMWYGYGRKLPSVMGFLSANLPYAVGLSVRNFLVYALSLVRLQGLGAGLVCLAYALSTDRKSWPREGLALAVVGAVQCVSVALMWSSTSGRAEPEHLAPPLMAMAIPAVGWAIWRMARERAWRAAMITVLVMATYVAGHAKRPAEPPAAATDISRYAPAVCAAVRTLGPKDVVASERPWPVWWTARRPTVILPRRLAEEQQMRFLREYDVRAIVAWPTEAAAWTKLRGVRTVFRDPETGIVAALVNLTALPPPG
jgi:hypothetical protein